MINELFETVRQIAVTAEKLVRNWVWITINFTLAALIVFALKDSSILYSAIAISESIQAILLPASIFSGLITLIVTASSSSLASQKGRAAYVSPNDRVNPKFAK